MENIKSNNVPKTTISTIVPHKTHKTYRDFWVFLKKQKQQIERYSQKLTTSELITHYNNHVAPSLSHINRI